MSSQLSHPSENFPVSSSDAARPVATFQQLQQLLQQSLRDLHGDANDLESTQERELSQALQQLTEKLRGILAEASNSEVPEDWEISSSTSPPESLQPVSMPQTPIHVMTSCEGVVLMANDAAIKALDFDPLDIGTVSLAERIPHEEWRFIRQHLRTMEPPQGSVSWIVSLALSKGNVGSLKKLTCVVTPMWDQSGKVTVWHWDLQEHLREAPTFSLSQLVPELEAGLFNGRSVEDCLGKICHELVQTFGYPFVWIATVKNGHRVRLRAKALTAGLDWNGQGQGWWARISRQGTLAQACLASEGTLVSGDAPHTGEFSWFPAGFQCQEAYCLPLSGLGETAGLLVVCSAIPQGFDLPVREWLQSLGRQIERLMARGLEIEQLRLHSAVIGAVHDAVCVTDPQGRIEWVNHAYTKLLGPEGYQVVGTSLSSFPHAQLQEVRSTLHGTSTAMSCVRTEVMEKGRNGESIVLEQVLTPLVDAQGKTTHFVILLHDVTARTVTEMQMKHQAYHDALTDLPNRIMFEDRLQLAVAQARRSGGLLALLFLDLDNFKSINDQYGHQMGDRLLRIVAKRLVTCVRTTDTVSRLSGDEFTIILQGLDRIQDIRQVAQKIVDRLTPPIQLAGHNISVQTSIGIAVYPKDSTNIRQLLATADQAMYRAKGYGGKCWYFATPEWNLE